MPTMPRTPDSYPDRKPVDATKPWWQNIGCSFRFQLDCNIGYVQGTLRRIDVIEYRKYVVVEVDSGFKYINIDHIISVEEQ